MNILQSSWQRSTIRRFGCWLFSWRTIRRFLLAGAVLLTLVALFYAVENWRGQRAWKAHVRATEARGEKIGWLGLVPPPVEDQQNFALTPLLRPIFDYTQGTNGMQWRDPAAMARLRALEIYQRGGTNLDLPSIGSLDKGTPTDLESFAAFYRGNTNYAQAAVQARPAQAVLTALETFGAELRELKAASVSRPAARFPINYEEQPPTSILLPHLAIIKGLVQVVALRAIANLDLGQSAEALADVQLGLRLSDSIRNEPLLIDHLVRIASLSITLQSIREGLVRHAWTAPQLAQIEKNLAALDLLAEHQHAMRGERALGIATCDYVRRLGWRFDSGLIFGNGDNLSTVPFQLFPSGWYYQNMVRSSQLLQQFSLNSVDVPARRVNPRLCDEFGKVLENMPTGPYTVLVKLLLPALSKATTRSARSQTLVNLALVSCALERYRLAEGRFPETLAKLMPHYLERVPNDMIDGQPLHYLVPPEGGYRLYSIGWNQQDEGGQLGWTNERHESIDSVKGDWVWSMPAPK